MVIIGAKGLAKEVLEIFARRKELDNLFFFDNVSHDLSDKLYDRFAIIRSLDDLRKIFERTNDFSFTLGLGNPLLRYTMQKSVSEIGGQLTSAISPKADIGSFGNNIGKGCTILSGAVITNGVTIGEGCLINPNCTLSHDVKVGEYVDISPGAKLTGHCSVGSFSQLGTNAVILPKIKIGENVIVGAGAVVTKDFPDNTMVAGVPAMIKKKLDPIKL